MFINKNNKTIKLVKKGNRYNKTSDCNVCCSISEKDLCKEKVKQLLPELMEDPCFDDTYILKNSKFKQQPIYEMSPAKLQKARAYRNYLNSVNLTKECKKINKESNKNKIFVNNDYYQGYYKLIKTNLDGSKKYSYHKLISGSYRYCNIITIPKNKNIFNYINQNTPKLTKKRILSYNIHNNTKNVATYHYINGAWTICEVNNVPISQPN